MRENPKIGNKKSEYLEGYSDGRNVSIGLLAFKLRSPNRSPAERVRLGSEEQQNERAMSFAME